MPRHKSDNAWSSIKTNRKLKTNNGLCTRKGQIEVNEQEIRENLPEIDLSSLPVELPDYTQWFKLDSINCIEKECAENIFISQGDDKNLNLDVYKTIRNKIVNLYRENTGHDASIVMKVHSLLNYWGIINYQVTNENGERVYNKKLKDEVLELRGNQSNRFNLPYKRPNYNNMLTKRRNYYDKMRETTTLPFELYSAEEVVRYAAELNSGCNVITTTRYPACSGCGSLCNTSYYILGPDTLGEVTNSVRNRGIWCTLCYCNSNYPLSFSKDNFVRIDVPPRLSETLSKLPDNRSPQCKLSENRFFRNNLFGSKRFQNNVNGFHSVQGAPNGDHSQYINDSVTADQKNFKENNLNNISNHFNTQNRYDTVRNYGKQAEKYKNKELWTASDFEKLYEAIRKYGTDWQSVAQHIGDETTPNECIFQFINAPLEKEITSKLKLTTYMEPPTHEDIGPNFPFFDSPNTIVTLLSFCASVVSPVVASSAAKAAFDIILNSCKNRNNNNKTNNNNLNGTNHFVQTSHLYNNHNDNELGSVTNSNSVKIGLGETIGDGTNNLENNGHLGNSNNQKNYVNHSSSNYVNGLGSSSSSLEHRNNTLNGSEHIRSDELGVYHLNNLEKNDDKTEPLNKYVEGSTLQMAAAAALRAAAARAGELALKEDDRLTEVLPSLISLKIRRITEKLNRYNETQEKMKERQFELERELNNILKCKID